MGGGGGGGAGEVQKKFMQGKIKFKKMQARREDQEKIPALAFHKFCTNLKKAGRKV